MAARSPGMSPPGPLPPPLPGSPGSAHAERRARRAGPAPGSAGGGAERRGGRDRSAVPPPGPAVPRQPVTPCPCLGPRSGPVLDVLFPHCCPRSVYGCCPSSAYHVFVQIPEAINCSNICGDVRVGPM